MLKTVVLRAEEEKRRAVKESIYYFKEDTHHHGQNVYRTVNVKGDSGEASHGNAEHGNGNWQRGDPNHEVAKNLAESWCSVLWKVEIASDELGYLTKEISKQNVEGVAWLLLVVYNKT